MKLVVGLGNPGGKYKNTRHNLGFTALDFLQKKLEAPMFKLNKRFGAEISKADKKIILAKPQTFMNNSGEATKKIMAFYKFAPEDLLVIHDDLDLSLGTIRISRNSGSAGHRGVQSIIDNLGTKNFTRLRLGIGRPENIPPEDYVLQNFTDEEKITVREVLRRAIETIRRLSAGCEC